MERLGLIFIIIFGIISIGAIILSSISLRKEDETFNRNITNSDGKTINMKDWFESDDGIAQISKVIQRTPFANNLILKNTNYTVLAPNKYNNGEFFLNPQNEIQSDDDRGGCPGSNCGVRSMTMNLATYSK